jgi:hypothetical protein
MLPPGLAGDMLSHGRRLKGFPLPDNARLPFFENLVVRHNLYISHVALLLFQPLNIDVSQAPDQNPEPWPPYDCWVYPY